MVASSYPSGVKVFIDDEDVTLYLFGVDALVLDDLNNAFYDIDINAYLKFPGRHKIKVTADTGAGRVEARVSIK